MSKRVGIWELRVLNSYRNRSWQDHRVIENPLQILMRNKLQSSSTFDDMFDVPCIGMMPWCSGRFIKIYDKHVLATMFVQQHFASNKTVRDNPKPLYELHPGWITTYSLSKVMVLLCSGLRLLLRGINPPHWMWQIASHIHWNLSFLLGPKVW